MQKICAVLAKYKVLMIDNQIDIHSHKELTSSSPVLHSQKFIQRTRRVIFQLFLVFKFLHCFLLTYYPFTIIMKTCGMILTRIKNKSSSLNIFGYRLIHATIDFPFSTIEIHLITIIIFFYDFSFVLFISCSSNCCSTMNGCVLLL